MTPPWPSSEGAPALGAQAAGAQRQRRAVAALADAERAQVGDRRRLAGRVAHHAQLERAEQPVGALGAAQRHGHRALPGADPLALGQDGGRRERDEARAIDGLDLDAAGADGEGPVSGRGRSTRRRRRATAAGRRPRRRRWRRRRSGSRSRRRWVRRRASRPAACGRRGRCASSSVRLPAPSTATAVIVCSPSPATGTAAPEVAAWPATVRLASPEDPPSAVGTQLAAVERQSALPQSSVSTGAMRSMRIVSERQSEACPTRVDRARLQDGLPLGVDDRVGARGDVAARPEAPLHGADAGARAVVGRDRHGVGRRAPAGVGDGRRVLRRADVDLDGGRAPGGDVAREVDGARAHDVRCRRRRRSPARAAGRRRRGSTPCGPGPSRRRSRSAPARARRTAMRSAVRPSCRAAGRCRSSACS